MSTLPETNNFTFENGWFLHMTCPFEAWPILRGKLAVSAASLGSVEIFFWTTKTAVCKKKSPGSTPKMDQNILSPPLSSPGVH